MRVAALLALLVLGLTATSAPARTVRARMTVEGESVEHWRGEPSSTRPIARLRAFVDGVELTDASVHGKCAAVFRHGSVVLKWTSCGAHIRLVVANVGAQPVRVRAWWRYAPARS